MSNFTEDEKEIMLKLIKYIENPYHSLSPLDENKFKKDAINFLSEKIELNNNDSKGENLTLGQRAALIAKENQDEQDKIFNNFLDYLANFLPAFYEDKLLDAAKNGKTNITIEGLINSINTIKSQTVSSDAMTSKEKDKCIHYLEKYFNQIDCRFVLWNNSVTSISW